VAEGLMDVADAVVVVEDMMKWSQEAIEMIEA
jgi:hypothetical protein